MLRGGAAGLAVLLLLVAPAAAQGYAPVAITVSQILDRNRHSVGSLQFGAYYAVTRTVSSNGDVWTEETYSNGSDFRTTVQQGGFVWSYGVYRGQQWQQDANGLVTASSNLFQDVDPFVASFRKPEALSSGVKLLGLTTDSPANFVVQVMPRNGLVERRYYDQRTYLLTRVELTDYDGHRQVWQYGDYRQVSGSTVAHRIDYERDGTAVTLETSVLSYAPAATATFDLSAPASRPLFNLGDHDAVVIPARFTDYGIIVPVSIAGRGLDFLLDSGSSDLLIDPDVASQLGMKSSGAVRVSFAGDFTMANARAANFSVGALNAQDVVFSTASFQEQLPTQRIVGLLGTDFIASGALEVDFKNKVITLFRSVPAGLAAHGWSELPLRMDYNVPLVKAAYSGLPGYFVADLGADYTTLYPHYFAQFPNAIPRGTPDQGEMVTLGGKPFGVRHLTMKRLVLGDWIFGDVQVVVPSVAYAQQRDYDGLIGRDTLSSFNLIFDYANRQLWFKPIDFSSK
jgi:hypothetical protein